MEKEEYQHFKWEKRIQKRMEYSYVGGALGTIIGVVLGGPVGAAIGAAAGGGFGSIIGSYRGKRLITRDSKDIKKVKEDLWEILKEEEDIKGIGISGEEEITVNVKEGTEEMFRDIPDECKGYSVEIKETGSIEPLESKLKSQN